MGMALHCILILENKAGELTNVTIDISLPIRTISFPGLRFSPYTNHYGHGQDFITEYSILISEFFSE